MADMKMLWLPMMRLEINMSVMVFIINCVVKPTALAVGYKTRLLNLRK